MFPHYQGYASPCTHSARYSEAPPYGYFHRGCEPGFGGSHVGAFRSCCSPPIAIKDHRLQIDWQNIILCDLDRNIIKLPALGKISLWSTNDLVSIETNIPYQIRVYSRVLDLVIPLEIKDDVHITDNRLY